MKLARLLLLTAAGAASVLTSAPALAWQPAASAYPAPVLSYADTADLALAAPVAAHVRLARIVPLRERKAVGVPPGHTRFLVEADVISLIRGPSGMPVRVSYLVDLRNTPDGRRPKLQRRSEHLVFAAPASGPAGTLRLVAPDGQVPFSDAAAEQLRSILRDAVVTDAPPEIIGIGRAFHVPGSLPGESETQVFLQTADSRPISLTVLRRPGEEPRWAVALGEFVDDAAEPPQPGTLLWYRLACTLPPQLPPASLAEADVGHHPAIASDYRLVLDALGPCGRTRAQR